MPAICNLHKETQFWLESIITTCRKLAGLCTIKISSSCGLFCRLRQSWSWLSQRNQNLHSVFHILICCKYGFVFCILTVSKTLKLIDLGSAFKRFLDAYVNNHQKVRLNSSTLSEHVLFYIILQWPCHDGLFAVSIQYTATDNSSSEYWLRIFGKTENGEDSYMTWYNHIHSESKNWIWQICTTWVLSYLLSYAFSILPPELLAREEIHLETL